MDYQFELAGLVLMLLRLVDDNRIEAVGQWKHAIQQAVYYENIEKYEESVKS